MVVCLGKIPYDNRVDSAREVRRFGKRGIKLHAYVCPRCGFIHIGRKAKTKRKLLKKLKELYR